MQIKTNSSVHVGPATTIDQVVEYAETIAGIEGKSQALHAARLTTAVGDLNASLCDPENLSQEEIHEEVASVVLRAVMLGLSYGITSAKLKNAIGRETEYLVKRGVEKRIDGAMNDAGLCSDKPMFPTGMFNFSGEEGRCCAQGC